MEDATRWGILGTSRIAATGLMPAIRATGARAVVVGGRNPALTRAYAAQHGIERVVDGYDLVIEAPDIQVIYNPLPNSLHAEWTTKALRAGKAVLCEKPLTADVPSAVAVLEQASQSKCPLWEAFVFPFHRQHERLIAIVRSGNIGSVREIHSEFHFHLTRGGNIRMDPWLGGGALNDVGCYPVRFAQLIFGAGPIAAQAVGSFSDSGVDVEMQGVLEYQGDRRLLMSCGMRRDSGTFTRLIGEHGEVRISNPFNAQDRDTVEVRSADSVAVESLGSSEPKFAPAVRHIEEVLRGVTAPLHTALDDSLATERGLELLRKAASDRREGQTQGRD